MDIIVTDGVQKQNQEIDDNKTLFAHKANSNKDKAVDLGFSITVS